MANGKDPKNVLKSDSIYNLNLLDSVVNKYRLILTGEDHRFASKNVKLELQMLKYLNEKADFKNLILELGYSRGYVLDQYVNNDSTYLDVLGSQTSYIYTKFCKDLRTFNLSLPIEKRIRVHGVDIERFPKEAALLMAHLLPADSVEVPVDIALLCESLRMYSKYVNSVYGGYDSDRNDRTDEMDGNIYYPYALYNHGYNNRAFIDSLVNGVEQFKSSFQAYLGQNFDVFIKSHETLKQNRIYQSYERLPQEQVFREMTMAANLEKLMDADSTSKYFGQFGKCHVLANGEYADCDWYNMKPLAHRITSKKYKGQLIAINLLYRSYGIKEYDYLDDCRKWLDTLDYNNGFHLYQPNDTCFKGAFNYVITVHSIYKEYVKHDEKLKTYYTALDLSVGRADYNFDALNQSLFSGKVKGFNPNMNRYGFNVHINEPYYLSFELGAFYNQSQTIQNGKTKMTLSGFSVYEAFGSQLVQSKHFSVSLHGMLAYNRFKLTISEDTASPLVANSFERNTYRYANNAITAGVLMDMRILLLNNLGLTFKGYYQFDPSFYRWRMSGGFNALDSVSPKTSHTTFGATAGLSIYFY
ncbi:MAG TPA: hypothetical protein VGF79_10280 [Bacteroidia bacterium]